MQSSCPIRTDPAFTPLPPFRAVVMDMDGLVLDTESTYCRAWRHAAAELGFALDDEFFRGLFGRHADDVKAGLADACGDSFDLQAFHAAAEMHWLAELAANGVARMPGFDRLLDTLRAEGLPYALATNSDEPYASLCLNAAGIASDFPVLVTRDQVRTGKPAPDVFLEAARRLGVAPCDCLALEDSATGLEACSSAGMIPVWVPPPHVRNGVHSQPDGVWIFPDLASVADRIEQRG
jgi:HAD superfamily hydrolase (TIGR01509 family)